MESVDAIKKVIRTIPDFPKRGITFKDITPILSDLALLKASVQYLKKPFEDQNITKVVAIESRGFVLGPMIALELGAGFVPVRKEGKLPRETYSVAYDLEYGSGRIEMHLDSILPSDRVLIHDDVLATGGTAAAAEELVERSGAEIVGFTFLLELPAMNGRSKLHHDHTIHAVVQG
ncbi:MAG: adenine phosphoribosyltransferase [Bacteroidetes bacterium]|nr:adenine phosphoribosyltransferase [Bacteroidota bacterium]